MPRIFSPLRPFGEWQPGRAEFYAPFAERAQVRKQQRRTQQEYITRQLRQMQAAREGRMREFALKMGEQARQFTVQAGFTGKRLGLEEERLRETLREREREAEQAERRFGLEERRISEMEARGRAARLPKPLSLKEQILRQALEGFGAAPPPTGIPTGPEIPGLALPGGLGEAPAGPPPAGPRGLGPISQADIRQMAGIPDIAGEQQRRQEQALFQDRLIRERAAEARRFRVQQAELKEARVMLKEDAETRAKHQAQIDKDAKQVRDSESKIRSNLLASRKGEEDALLRAVKRAEKDGTNEQIAQAEQDYATFRDSMENLVQAKMLDLQMELQSAREAMFPEEGAPADINQEQLNILIRKGKSRADAEALLKGAQQNLPGYQEKLDEWISDE